MQLTVAIKKIASYRGESGGQHTNPEPRLAFEIGRLNACPALSQASLSQSLSVGRGLAVNNVNTRNR